MKWNTLVWCCFFPIKIQLLLLNRIDIAMEWGLTSCIILGFLDDYDQLYIACNRFDLSLIGMTNAKVVQLNH